MAWRALKPMLPPVPDRLLLPEPSGDFSLGGHLLLDAPPWMQWAALTPFDAAYAQARVQADQYSLARFNDWARRESMVLSPALAITHDAAGGYTVTVQRPVKKGHTLVRLPVSLALTADGAIRALPHLLSRSVEGHVAIAVWLMHLVERPPSRLRPYLDALRTATIDCTVRWNVNELEQLQGSVARKRALSLRAWADMQWDALPKLGHLNASRGAFDWALCAVWSRSFHLRCADPSCDDAAGTSDGLIRVFAPGADLLNMEQGDAAAAVLQQAAEGVRPADWRDAGKSLTGSEDEAVTVEKTRSAASMAYVVSERRKGAFATSLPLPDASAEKRRQQAYRQSARTRKDAGNAAARERRGRRRQQRGGAHSEDAPRDALKRASSPSSGRRRGADPAATAGALAEGLSDVALGGGRGVWLWSEGSADGGGMDAKWMQRVCLHELCIPEPDATGEAWDAVSAVSANASEGAVILRSARDLEVGEEVTLDYGARPNAELLTTHGFALPKNQHDAIPISLVPQESDPHGTIKTKILSAGNITAPFALSPMALQEDSDLLVALRIIAATPTELKRYADAFAGKQLSVRNEHKWRLLLREQLSLLSAQAEKVTTLEEDATLLRGGFASRGTNIGEQRWRAAVLCRLGEKQLLRTVLSDVELGLQRTASSL
jgi:hypothetical protein